MNKGLLAIIGCSFTLFFMQGAAAKTINMGTHSRAAVQQACDRSGGADFGMTSDDSEYGCRSAQGTVLCEPDSNCAGLVSDLIPMTGTSLDAILGVRNQGGATRVAPVNSRVNSTVAE